MAEKTRNLCAEIPLDLHTKVRQRQAESGETLSRYMTALITKFYEMEENVRMDKDNVRTVAFQVPTELFEQLKAYLKRNGIKQNPGLHPAGAGGGRRHHRRIRNTSREPLLRFSAAVLLWRNKMFIYPENLKAKPMLWLWLLRDIAVIGIGALLSVLALTQGLGMGLLVVTVLYAFLTIQVDGSSILDFLRRAACFLFLRQQYYEWRLDP